MTMILADESIKAPPSVSNTFSNMRSKNINMTTIIISFFRTIVLEIESLPQRFPINTVFSRDQNHIRALPEKDKYNNNFLFTSS
jgi:hypothetical protein